MLQLRTQCVEGRCTWEFFLKKPITPFKFSLKCLLRSTRIYTCYHCNSAAAVYSAHGFFSVILRHNINSVVDKGSASLKVIIIIKYVNKNMSIYIYKVTHKYLTHLKNHRNWVRCDWNQVLLQSALKSMKRFHGTFCFQYVILFFILK